MFMQNFCSLAYTQTDLDKFLTIFEENSRNFQKNLLFSKFQKCPNLSIQFSTQPSMFMQNFSSPASTQTDLDKFLTFFEEKFKIFLIFFRIFQI
jgi:hypothetical protein